MSEISGLTQEFTKGYRTYFSLLSNYHIGNHEKIMTQLGIQRELERQLIALVGKEAAFELGRACYQQVLSEYS